MASRATLQSRLDEIDEILAGGVIEDEVDGQRTKWDLESLRLERNQITQKLYPGNRPTAATIYLGGF